MNNLNLPADLLEFLSNRQQLEYDFASVEAGAVKLNVLADLELGEVWINSDESPLGEDDPHAGEDGYYTVPAVSLTGESEVYDPEFILLWLPNEKLFGTWDCDHWDLYTFPNTSWENITSNPAKYLDAQWSDYERKISEYFKPYPKYEFKTGMPF